MFDIGWSELVLIGIVALVVVGPKDLPAMFRTLGRVTAKGRMMARDFQRAMEDAADEAGLKDIQRDLNSIRSPMQSGLDAVNRKLDDWDARTNRVTPSGVSPPSAANGSAPPPAAPVPPAATAPLETPSSAHATDPAGVAAVEPRTVAPEPVSEPAVAKASAESPGDGTKV
ncbi:preprotein translocase subunit TatB [Haematobacter missouriensis]|uniref:Sec-independent protein translocase protein TatB n=1 Tax=Haematobacter missouriensis TaxID=366616 RepID=A0A212ATE0_9RHOB|nr:Sec-independent protein translocase protein TatB [Haematobacter missouriensis]KFI26109.1 preprotein translocase subunit TatB [Haematobacter missouriensis]OWJ78042.1 twin-arginine translocase subunit TatB [Haematobacter missouriensis]OWJ84750.1 twin-arginine translocase subunit TatB [Haematobacter missouriensis]